MSIVVINKRTGKELSQQRLETYDKYCRVLNWGRRYPIEFCDRFFGIELLDYQKYAVWNSWTKQFMLWLQSRNAGKDLALDTRIPTPDGDKTIEEVHVGDYVFDENGEPVRVIAESPIYTDHRCYEIVFEDGERITCGEDHLWKVRIAAPHWTPFKGVILNKIAGANVDKAGYAILSTREVAGLLSREGMRVLGIFVPLAKQFQDKLSDKAIVSVTKVKTVKTKCIQVDSPRGLFLCGNKDTVTHNSTLLAIYTMLRSILLPFHSTYFISNVGGQAKETWVKLEKIAKREIESFVGSTDVFASEVVRNGSVGDGWSKPPESFRVELFNGSAIYTLNSDPTNIRGKRASLVCFDESSFMEEELMIMAEQFANQDTDFKLGGGINVALEPKGFPRQLLYASSASDTESAFYGKMRSFTANMMMGNPNYFVCNFDIDAVMKATVNGEKLEVPLISQEKVDQAMHDNLEKAQRELFNHFSSEMHEGQILTRRDIMMHTKPYTPIMFNENGTKQFMLSWDSARLNDNSVILAAELIDDPDVGWKMRLANIVSLVDVKTKNKTPMRIPQQVAEFKKLLLTYNGSDYGKQDYENINSVILDAGAGGGMLGISDYLLDDWADKHGTKHKGLIDTSHKINETNKYSFPNAVDCVKLVDPKGNRNDIYESIEKMVKLGVVEFPMDYDLGKEYVVTINEDGEEERHDLTVEEQISLANVELLKTEIISMCKYVSLGQTVQFAYAPEKRSTMHDDRIFAFGLLCWRLAQLRRGQVVRKDPEPMQVKDMPTFVTAISFD